MSGVHPDVANNLIERLLDAFVSDAIECPDCMGTGNSSLGMHPALCRVCYCGGLGWLPASEPM
jgi:hypothetical protein